MIQVVNDSADTRKMLHITVEGVMVIVPTKRSSNRTSPKRPANLPIDCLILHCRIDLGSMYGRVPKDRRDYRHVYTFKQQDCRTGMPCTVEAEMLLDSQSVSDSVQQHVGPGIRR